MAGPVNRLSGRMPRGAAIALSYVVLLLVPVMMAAIVVPPVVTQANALVQNAPQYAADVQEFVAENDSLRNLEEDYGVVSRLREEAEGLTARIGDAAGALRDLGVGLVNSIFAAVTILILSVFMVSGGPGWVRRALSLQGPERADRFGRVVARMGAAVGAYVGGALVQATIAGLTTFLVLTILGVPGAAPLAVVVFFFDLIPLVGATIGAVIVGVVTIFGDFPTDTIVWAVWAIVYQQIENNVIQPQIQRRAVDVAPIVVLVSVLFGSTLFGIAGALLAIPIAASVQIALLEWWAWRTEERRDVERRVSSTGPAASR
jgi:predicted PurR-regulated permease PerM